MVFRHIHKKLHPNGFTETLVTEFPQSEVIIGRGGRSHIIFSSQRVSLVHATLVFQGGVLVVADQGSSTGVRLNQRRVSRANVGSGDTIILGDIEIEVAISGDVVELTSKSLAMSTSSDADRTLQEVLRLQIDHYLPSMKALVFGVLAISLAVFLVYPFASQDISAWNSGPISNSHKLIEADCQKCHAEPFKHVQDRECLTCHQMTKHAQDFDGFVSQHPGLEMRCGQCHMEHNGDHGLIVKDADFCVSCHGAMSDRKGDTSVLDVPSFEAHPEFRISVKDSTGTIARVNIGDSIKAVDHSQIKLNHEIHLKPGLRGKEGPVTLQCNNCHQLSPNFKTLKPISFDTHCRDCHGLGFDERLPYIEAPHGNVEAVYPALFTEYTKLLLLKEDSSLPQDSKELARMYPADIERANSTPHPIDTSLVVASARSAEQQLFTRTGCFLCHAYAQKPEQECTDTNSHYTITKPGIPEVWLPGARFSHGAHEEFSCESCHEKTRHSTQTSELLLPQKKLCQECHSQEKKEGYVTSGCAECHSYHDALGIPAEKKQSISEYLHSLTR